MNAKLKFRNDLKTGTGIRRFMQPANSDVLSAPQNHFIGDDLIPDELKHKGLNLSYSPQSYKITLNDKNAVILVDICGKETELPQTLALFRDGEIPELRINGYALFIDINTGNYINSLPLSARKTQMREVSRIFSHFNKIHEVPPQLSVVHELKHLSNKYKVQEICGEIEKSGLSAEQFALTRYADEISASAQEFLYSVQEYNKTRDVRTIPAKYASFAAHIAEPETQNILHNPLALSKIATELWLSSENNRIYTGTKGDFVTQTNRYAQTATLGNPNSNQNNFTGIISAYMTLSFEEKNIDCSSILGNIKPAPYIYEDATEILRQRKEQYLGASHRTRQMHNIKSK